MMSEWISFRRHYTSDLSRGTVGYGIVDGKMKLSISDLQQYFEETNEPIAAEVEAHWEGSRRPDRITFCGATYNFIPLSGLIVAQTTALVEGCTTEPGVVVHPNSTVRNSTIGRSTEISNTTTILDSRIGYGCFIGSNVVIDNCPIYDRSHINNGEIHQSGVVEPYGRDLTELAFDGARW